MDEEKLAAAITLQLPEQLGWAIQSEDHSWTGKDMRGFLDCIGAQSTGPITLSVSLLFELTGNGGTVRSKDDTPGEGAGYEK